MTRRLFDEDAYLFTFSATVERCRETPDGFAVLLDGTAFFPQGGGQCADGGTLSGLPVRDVQQEGDEIWHFVPQALIPGQTVQGTVDREERLARMRKHSAEHIVCGLIHRAYGFSNVGFHLGSEDVTLDIDGELDRPAIDEIERQAKRDLHVDLVIHYDPIVTDDPEVTAVHTRVTQILRGIDPRLSIHDFRMVSGPHHANVIFDMVIPAEYEDKTAQLRREVEAQLQDGKKVYHLVITFDTAAFNEMTKEAQG